MTPGEIVFEGKTKKDLEVLIRYPKQGDAQIMLDYINTLSAEKTFIFLQGRQLTQEEEQKYLDDQLNKIENNKVIKLLVFHKQQLIAISDIDMREDAEKHIGYFGISVSKDYRGQGLGSLLMKLVLDEAEKNLKDLRIIVLSAFGDNEVAKSMYKKFGFEEFGTLPGGVLHADVPVDSIYMYKKVA